MASNPAGTIIAVTTIGIMMVVFLLLSGILVPFISGFTGGAAAQFDDPEITNDSGSVAVPSDTTFTDINNSTASLNDKVQFNATGNVSLDTDIDEGDAWSACTLATANQSVVTNNEERQVLGYNDLVIYYNGSIGNWSAWYFDDGKAESEIVTLNATAPTQQTALCFLHETDNLTLYRNTTASTTVQLDGSGQADVPNNTAWNGSIEETRIYDYALNSTQRSNYSTSPAIAVQGNASSARIMYDVRDRSTSSVPAYFASGDASITNASFTDGLDGPTISEGVDYDHSGSDISIPSTSALDGDGDVLFVNYSTTSDDTVGTVITQIDATSSLGGVLMIVLTLGALLAVLGRLR